jgi:hypothetical protein
MKKIVFLLFLIIAVYSTSFSAYIRNYPVELVQPDGIRIRCFLTGDEFHHRIHDSDSFTILLNQDTHYYVYAIKSGDNLIASKYIAGKTDPHIIGIEPGIDIPSFEIEKNAVKYRNPQTYCLTPIPKVFSVTW